MFVCLCGTYTLVFFPHLQVAVPHLPSEPSVRFVTALCTGSAVEKGLSMIGGQKLESPPFYNDKPVLRYG